MSFISNLLGKKADAPQPPLKLKSLTDRRGKRVGVEHIKPHHFEEHMLTVELLEEGRELSERLSAFREKCLTRIPKHRTRIAETHNVKLRPNKGAT